MKHIRSSAFVARPSVPFHMPAAQDNGLPVPVVVHLDIVRFLSVYEEDSKEVAWGRDFVDGKIAYRYRLSGANLEDQINTIRNRLLSSEHLEVADCPDPSCIDSEFRAGRVVSASIDIFHPHYRLAGIEPGQLFSPQKERVDE